ncbi:uncharacterized protein DNG_02180 [Cephalotrichum gorgonifer]|uniref:NUDIX domain-containing protein n=1 Tax=Cephalotrichum gorgonifer TaxID=2041049 RepID=A0AAE8MSW7_9PEZI|nr:uncharacterized protein DNG_02180 [Cephalotrichum gorgonifer]
MERPLRDTPRLEPSSQSRWGDDGFERRVTLPESHLRHLDRIYKAAGAAAAWRRPTRRRSSHRALGDSDHEYHACGGFAPAESLVKEPAEALGITPFLSVRFFLRRIIYTKPWATMFLSSSISDSSHIALLTSPQPSHLAISNLSNRKLLTHQSDGLRMSTQDSTYPGFDPSEVIKKCNQVPEDQHEFWDFMLPNTQGVLEKFGILLPKVVIELPWNQHGFELDDKVVRPQSGKSDPAIISANLKALTLDPISTLAFPDLKNWKKEEFAGLIGGHPEIRFPDYLVPYIGVVQVGVHLTVYSDSPEGLQIYVQRRSNTGGTTYPGMLDQFAAGGLKHNETAFKGLKREASEEATGAVINYKNVEYTGDVSFFTKRDTASGKFLGTLEISAKACYAFEADKAFKESWGGESNDLAVGGFKVMSVDQVITALQKDEFKPNSALVMLHFLLNKTDLKNHKDYLAPIRTIPYSLQLPHRQTATMPRYMVQVRASAEGESGAPPTEERMLQMMAFNKSLADAGVMLSGNGLLASSKGARISFDAAGGTTVTPGPFALETVVSGYWILETKDLDEAIDWARKAPLKPGATLEVRKVSGPEDF